MKTIDIKFEKVCREMEIIENEAGILMNNHRKNIARYIINHFVNEHLPPAEKKEPLFSIPKDLKDDSTVKGTGEVERGPGVDILGPAIPEKTPKG